MGRGGKRSGAGRKPSAKDAATREQILSVGDIARNHTETAILILVRVMENSESDAARVSAANAILDRGYGKPKVPPDWESRADPELKDTIVRKIVDSDRQVIGRNRRFQAQLMAEATEGIGLPFAVQKDCCGLARLLGVMKRLPERFGPFVCRVNFNGLRIAHTVRTSAARWFAPLHAFAFAQAVLHVSDAGQGWRIAR